MSATPKLLCTLAIADCMRLADKDPPAAIAIWYAKSVRGVIAALSVVPLTEVSMLRKGVDKLTVLPVASST